MHRKIRAVYVALFLILIGINTTGCSWVPTTKFDLQGPVKNDWLDVDKSYRLARILETDDRGNVFVTGGKNTFKYDSKGKRTTFAKDNYPNSYVAAMTIDNLGNIYLAGDYVVKLDPTGKLVWANKFKDESSLGGRASKIQIDDIGNIIAVGLFDTQSGAKYAAAKYTNTGEIIWAAPFSDEHGVSISVSTYNWDSVLIEKAGNINFTGNSGTVKYDSQGKELWNGNRGGVAVAIDNSGNIYITGKDGTTKYNQNGNILWNNSEEGSALAIDNSGDIYITNHDSHTILCDSEGNTIWKRNIGGSHISVDASGAIYVPTNDNFFGIVKFSSEGSLKWIARLIQGASGNYVPLRSLTVDKLGNVFAAGQVTVHQFLSDFPSSAYAVVKYSQK